MLFILENFTKSNDKLSSHVKSLVKTNQIDKATNPHFYLLKNPTKMIGIDSNTGYTKAELAKSSSFLTVGFGYTFYFNGKKSKTSGDD